MRDHFWHVNLHDIVLITKDNSFSTLGLVRPRKEVLMKVNFIFLYYGALAASQYCLGPIRIGPQTPGLRGCRGGKTCFFLQSKQLLHCEVVTINITLVQSL